jgi:DNA-binding NarL/FixJ family response regulator
VASAAGLTDDEISHGVYLSCQTVRNRISRMLERSGARNRTHLASIHIHDQYNNLDSVLPHLQPAHETTALRAG